MPLPPLPAFIDAAIMWATGLLAGTLLAGAVAIALARRWRKRQGEVPDAGSELSRYRALYEKGEISEEEYHRLRDVLRGQMKTAFGAGKPAPGPASPSEGVKPP
ncbi:MAG: SHOCT domain-containing protein [Gemmataceae bacterium]|nr:SHOCT domain-containing protein [Gemmataceae bacterium]